MITIQSNTPEQINSAILSLDGDISQMKQDVKEQMASLKSSVTTQAAGLTDGSTYNINIKGNAATADKVNSALTVSGTNSFTAASSTTYNGSTAKTATIYTPDQSVNSSSSPTFAQVTAALSGNASTATKLAGGPSSGCGFIYKEYNYSNIPSLNMNYYTDSGIYTFLQDMNTDTSKSLVNAPIAQTNGGWCLMSIREGSNYNVQIFHPYDYASIYVRCSYYGGSVVGTIWSGWSEK